jgi:hypothetical protein
MLIGEIFKSPSFASHPQGPSGHSGVVLPEQVNTLQPWNAKRKDEVGQGCEAGVLVADQGA